MSLVMSAAQDNEYRREGPKSSPSYLVAPVLSGRRHSLGGIQERPTKNPAHSRQTHGFYIYLQRVGSGTRLAEVSHAAAGSQRVIPCRF